MSSKMWGGRFTEVPSEFVEEFGAAIKDQIRLCSYDIQGSLAHVTMLGETGILAAEDVELIKKGLKQVAEEIEKGQFIFAAEDEDIHMAIEKRLTQIIGQAAVDCIQAEAAMINVSSTAIFTSVRPQKHPSI